MNLTKINGLNPEEYLHPFDKKALHALQNTKGLDTLVKKLYEWGLETYLKQQFLGSSLKLTQSNFPDVYDIFETACDLLDFKQRPTLYVMREGYFDCVSCGVENTIIVIGTDALEKFTEAELLFTFGREIGHIQCRHVLYSEIGQVMPVLMDALSSATLGLGGLLSAGIQFALIEWLQCAQYTADRAGILACQDVTVACTALIKSAGLPAKYDPTLVLDDFKTQAIEFQGVNKNMILKFAKYATQNKGWEIARANQFFQWTESGEYRNVLERKTAYAPLPPGAVNFCSNCGARLAPGGMFCTNCGTKVGG
ncbi:MAG: M48 family metalloprotease [Saprospiraceae bacterium]|nr:M48 family metalloprotease [Saprospiraceae bacterium]